VSGPLPTLGPQVCHFIDRFGVHGPGPLKGRPFVMTMEERAFLWDAYEVEPDPYRPEAMGRRYRHGIYCRPKGCRKTEFMAQVALVEFDGPCVFSHVATEPGVDEWGWEYRPGDAVGVRRKSPDIPVVATTEGQAERLVWGVMRSVFQHTPLAARYKVLADTMYFVGATKEDGWAYLLPPNNPEAADGLKPTFVPREEPHLWLTKDLRQTAEFMDRGVVKIPGSWTMDATTMYAPGEASVLEESVAAIGEGDKSVLFDVRSASPHWNLNEPAEWLGAITEAHGEAMDWINVKGLRALFDSPRKDRNEFRRFHLNQAVSVANKPFSGDKLDKLVDPKRTPAPSKKTPIVLFLDGAKTRDSTALIAWTVEERPHLFLAGLWERPEAGLRLSWHVPVQEVRDQVSELWDDYTVVLLGGDADRYWSGELEAWGDRYGDERVVSFPTRHGKLMGNAIDNFVEEMSAALSQVESGGVPPWTWDGSPEIRKHFASVVLGRRPQSPYRILQKASEAMDDKIDVAVAAVCGFALIPSASTMVEDLTKTRRVGIY